MEKNIGVRRDVLTRISKENLEVDFTSTGEIHSIRSGDILFNQLFGQEIDGALSNIYLRFLEADKIKFYPLIGSRSGSRFFAAESQAMWQGKIEGISYRVRLKLAENAWFWQVSLSGHKEKIDLVYVNDIGLADRGALLSNEAYNAQYINHQIFDSHNFKIVSRQNQAQSTGFPVLETGALGDRVVTGYVTDGFQFFGKSFKRTRVPELLTQVEFPNQVLQYEMALTALKTEGFECDHDEEIVFYQKFQANSDTVPDSFTEPDLLSKQLAAQRDEDLSELTVAKAKIDLGKQLNGNFLDQQTIKAFYPEARFEEEIGGKILSGFTKENVHFVSIDKELIVEREHGEIFLSGQSMTINDRGLATSSFIYGLFNAHVVIGNTTMNKLLSNQRDHLNLHQVSGQRIFVKIDGQYQMLGLPSLFEMGYYFARWIYVLKDDVIRVTNFVSSSEASLQLELESENGKFYDFLVLNQVVMDEMEYHSTAHLSTIGNDRFVFTVGDASAAQMGNPDLAYEMKFDHPVRLLEPESLFDQATFIEESLVVFAVSTDNFKIKISGSLDGDIVETGFLDFELHKKAYKKYVEEKLLNGFKFTSSSEAFDKVNTILPWYAHDMMIHYLSPHGLEQYGGAAWGTRDVSQGPIEFFLSTGHPEVAREILLTLFSHQFEEDGTWPQWFMFDEYQPIFSGESHGDVIVWPMFALAEYLERTADLSILVEDLPFVSRTTGQFTQVRATLHQHLQKEISYITSHFLPQTHLSIYGNGDWDDTLQPANSTLKDHMTSSWTDSLTYQAFIKLATVLKAMYADEGNEYQRLAEAIKSDFEKYLIQEDVIPGFALQVAENFEPIIHPKDTKTQMHYRLLPMDRSMISELASIELVEKNVALIDENLTFMDGVRLMEHSPEYKGGVSVNFKRAEQAANFGREIGLLYVHAQIRYVEAMAKIGKNEKAWHALLQTIPVAIKQTVPNAEARQANVYFSSSDGAFNTRYEAQKHFEQLKTGEVAVKGGWRLYSSGPGIFTHQVISHLAGIKNTADSIILDPIFPGNQREMAFDFVIDDKKVHIQLVKTDKPFVSLDGVEIESEKLQNRYRNAGIQINKTKLIKIHQDSVLTVEI